MCARLGAMAAGHAHARGLETQGIQELHVGADSVPALCVEGVTLDVSDSDVKGSQHEEDQDSFLGELPFASAETDTIASGNSSGMRRAGSTQFLRHVEEQLETVMEFFADRDRAPTFTDFTRSALTHYIKSVLEASQAFRHQKVRKDQKEVLLHARDLRKVSARPVLRASLLSRSAWQSMCDLEYKNRCARLCVLACASAELVCGGKREGEVGHLWGGRLSPSSLNPPPLGSLPHRCPRTKSPLSWCAAM